MFDRILKFIYSLWLFLKSGMVTASDEVFHNRLKTCNICEYRKDDKCSICGCYLKIKARWKSEHCPKSYW